MPEQQPTRRRFLFARSLRRHAPWLARLYGLGKQGFPFMWPVRHPSEMRRLRANVRRTMFAHRPLLQRWGVRMAMLAGWPFGAVIDTLYNLAYADCPRDPVSLMRRGGSMLAAALGGNVMPLEYVAYRLHEPGKRDSRDDYLYWSEDGIFRLLNARRGADNDDVQDKARFAVICRRHGLPCIPTLAAYRGGRQQEPEAPFVPDQAHLWVKDLAGKQGQGAAEWRLEGNAYRNAEGLTQTPQQLAAAWRMRDCIVQPFVRNHPGLDALSCGLLISARILTGIDPGGKVHLISHHVYLPWGGWNNRVRFVFGKVGGDGRISRAMKAGDRQEVVRHPDSDAVISESVVPFWSEALDLAQRAHRVAFPRFVFLGWDVAMTAEGPLLIEANCGPGLFHHQKLDDAPLGHTAFPGIALQYLEDRMDRTCD